MSLNTSIEWTQATWNPVRGCSPVSPGCKNCYAERHGGRFCGPGKPFEGFIQIGKNGNPGPHWTGKVELIPHMLDVPLRTRRPTTWFVNSMSDLFHESLPDETIDRVFAVMALCTHHTFQVLTKRSKRMREYFTAEESPYFYPCTRVEKLAREMAIDHDFSQAAVERDWPLPNVWLGVSVEDQQHKCRIDDLRETPAAVRFVSFEPLLEDLVPLDLSGIDLAIWGGESGPGARPCDVQWIRNGMQFARIHGCQNFVKQLGARAVTRTRTDDRWPDGTRFQIASMHEPQVFPRQIVKMRNKKGGNPEEWPIKLRVRQIPEVRA